jgi:gamma-glutamylcyclotransferase (GGCT)/AIG2-like uncharacterized protein YtfP
MKRRCKDSVPIAAGSLPCYRLSFTGVLTIESHPKDFVVGGIYEVSPNDERALDRYEGFPHMYSKRYTHVKLNGSRRTVFYYVLNEPYTLSTPSSYYYEIVEQGYRDFGLDVKHLKASRKRAAKVEKTRRSKYDLDTRKWGGYSSYTPDYTALTDGTIDYQEWSDSFDKEWAGTIAKKDWEGVGSEDASVDVGLDGNMSNKEAAEKAAAEAEWSEAFDAEYKQLQAW